MPYKFSVFYNQKVSGLLKRALASALSRQEMMIVRAQQRWHRRFDLYAVMVREQEPAMEWKEAKKTEEWKLVKEAGNLVRRLRKHA